MGATDASRPGGLKRKTLIASGKSGVVFQGEVISDSAAPDLDRTTLTPLDGGRVRQLIEISTDAGSTRRPAFDGYCARR